MVVGRGGGNRLHLASGGSELQGLLFMQHCQGKFERCLIVFHLLLIPCLMARKNS